MGLPVSAGAGPGRELTGMTDNGPARGGEFLLREAAGTALFTPEDFSPEQLRLSGSGEPAGST